MTPGGAGLVLLMVALIALSGVLWTARSASRGSLTTALLARISSIETTRDQHDTDMDVQLQTLQVSVNAFSIELLAARETILKIREENLELTSKNREALFLNQELIVRNNILTQENQTLQRKVDEITNDIELLKTAHDALQAVVESHSIERNQS